MVNIADEQAFEYAKPSEINSVQALHTSFLSIMPRLLPVLLHMQSNMAVYSTKSK